ncbi:hypothetical protein LJC53_05445 [Bacteroidales bacterium OttesenSCG-928-C03]|nr:hypothetical protein [Bacteroidales bacterium OttesenSCG-928-C03]
MAFRTKCSKKTINQENVIDLYKYINGIIKNKKCILYRIDSMEHHKKEDFQEEIKGIFDEEGLAIENDFFID